MEQKKWQNRGDNYPQKGGYQNPPASNQPFVAKFKDEDTKVEIDIQFSKNWISDKIELDTVRYADDFGRSLARTLTTSQLRNFFGEVRRIQMQREFKFSDFLLLKPKLAYAAQRKSGAGVKELKLVLDLAHDAVTNTKDVLEMKVRFERFVSFLEAILAYHKGHGGKDTGR